MIECISNDPLPSGRSNVVKSAQMILIAI